MTPKIVISVVHKKEAYPEGALNAVCYLEGGGSKSKQCSLHITDHEVAFETIDLWCQDRAKEFNIDYKKPDKNALFEQIATGKRKLYSRDNTVKPATASILSNKKYFNNEITRQFEILGYERIKENIIEARKTLDALERNRNKKITEKRKTNKTIAEALYTSFMETGVNPQTYINDEDLLSEFTLLREKKNNQQELVK